MKHYNNNKRQKHNNAAQKITCKVLCLEKNVNMKSPLFFFFFCPGLHDIP